jgi:exodeoxyribonuclease X
MKDDATKVDVVHTARLEWVKRTSAPQPQQTARPPVERSSTLMHGAKR